MHGFTENYVKVKSKFDPELWNEPTFVALKRIDADGSMIADYRLQITDFNSQTNLQLATSNL